MECTPLRTYANITAVLVPTGCPCTTAKCTPTTDPATTTPAAERPTEKKRRLCKPGRVALPAESIPPSTYAENKAALVPTGCPCTTAKCTQSTEVAASTARAYTAAGVKESEVLECTWAQVTTPTLVATRNTTTACTSWTATETPPV
ncbi:expressed unknown protein [Ectocarpus siliculosus]|uniref:Uncharacterized protein n=1 Tax=Ectocarpus siliculosus TaxID=2880 RepID=D8LJW9_ECTSI|nr:expressed unknown protein [Ectocarpus siliculosus]|eukprot:CBN76020.1 expressed unknown protein [Ectocarpus siliculosus]